MPNLQESRSNYTFGTSPVSSRRPYSTGPTADSLSVNNSMSPPGSHVMAHSPPPSAHVANLSQQQQLPPACGARQLSKLKRFLTTLQQFGADISPGIGDHVRALVLALVNSQLSVEDFHGKLQQATNFPLRPFVIPFLKANLPLLQRELLHCAHLARQSPHQYLMHHDRALLDAGSPGNSSRHDPGTLGVLAAPTGDVSPPSATPGLGPVKRKSPDERAQDMSCAGRQSVESVKRRRSSPTSPLSVNTTSASGAVGGLNTAGVAGLLSGNIITPGGTAVAQRALAAVTSSGNNNTSGGAAHLGSTTASVARYMDDDVNFLRDLREINRVSRDQLDTPIDARIHSAISNGSHSPEKPAGNIERMSDDLKRVENLLESVVSMVDECKSAVKSLRRQCQLTTNLRGSDPSQADHVNQRAVAEAVSEVKRQAVVELRKAVAESELKANQLIAAERGRLDLVVAEARQQAIDEILLSLRTTQHDSTEVCWNCGRKASETCSGCNTARYCGAFCQHKDWETHHKICGTPAAAAAGCSRRTSGDASAHRDPSPVTGKTPGGPSTSLGDSHDPPAAQTKHERVDEEEKRDETVSGEVGKDSADAGLKDEGAQTMTSQSAGEMQEPTKREAPLTTTSDDQ